MTNRLLTQAAMLRRRQTQFAPWLFAKYYLGKTLTVPPSATHLGLYRQLVHMTQSRGRYLAVAAPRSFGKTTMVTFTYVLWSICHAHEAFILIVAATKERASEFLMDVGKALTTTAELWQVFPEVMRSAQHAKLPEWTKMGFETFNGVKVLALGRHQSPRGLKHAHFRPTLIIGDDLEQPEFLCTPEARQKLQRWFEGDLLNAGDERTNVTLLGTLYHPHCLLGEYLDPVRHPRWTGLTFRAILSPPAHPERWEQCGRILHGQELYAGASGLEATRRFHADNHAVMEEGIELLWPQRYRYFELWLKMQEAPLIFNAEWQNQPFDPATAVFNPDEYTMWDKNFPTPEHLAIGCGEPLSYFGACDPSLGKGDRSAIIVLARGQRSGVLYVLVADIKRRSTDQILTDILAYGKRYAFKKFAVETNQFQELLFKQLEERSRRESVYLPLVKITNTGNKQARILGLQPLPKNGTLQLNSGHTALIEEFREFPLGKYDDGLDALEMAVRVVEDDPDDGPMILSTDRPDLPPGDTGVVLDEPIWPIEPGRRRKEVKELPFF